MENNDAYVRRILKPPTTHMPNNKSTFSQPNSSTTSIDRNKYILKKIYIDCNKQRKYLKTILDNQTIYCLQPNLQTVDCYTVSAFSTPQQKTVSQIPSYILELLDYYKLIELRKVFYCAEDLDLCFQLLEQPHPSVCQQQYHLSLDISTTVSPLVNTQTQTRLQELIVDVQHQQLLFLLQENQTLVYNSSISWVHVMELLKSTLQTTIGGVALLEKSYSSYRYTCGATSSFKDTLFQLHQQLLQQIHSTLHLPADISALDEVPEESIHLFETELMYFQSKTIEILLHLNPQSDIKIDNHNVILVNEDSLIDLYISSYSRLWNGECFFVEYTKEYPNFLYSKLKSLSLDTLKPYFAIVAVVSYVLSHYSCVSNQLPISIQPNEHSNKFRDILENRSHSLLSIDKIPSFSELKPLGEIEYTYCCNGDEMNLFEAYKELHFASNAPTSEQLLSHVESAMQMELKSSNFFFACALLMQYKSNPDPLIEKQFLTLCRDHMFTALLQYFIQYKKPSIVVSSTLEQAFTNGENVNWFNRESVCEFITIFTSLLEKGQLSVQMAQQLSSLVTKQKKQYVEDVVMRIKTSSSSQHSLQLLDLYPFAESVYAKDALALFIKSIKPQHPIALHHTVLLCPLLEQDNCWTDFIV